MKFQSDVERVIYDVLTEHAANDRDRRRDPDQPTWVQEFGSFDDLHAMVARKWKRDFPDRRNRPTFRATQNALKRLREAGLIEFRIGSDLMDDNYYRVAP